jgi:hypothetical protein
MMLVSSSSFVNAFSMSPSWSLQLYHFSRIHDARPTGESLRPNPSVCGFVDWISW